MAQKNVVVIGAGVAGLTTALLLSKVPGYKIVVAAKHMPGDYDIEYASPWAGANYMPVSVRGTKAAEWDKNTWSPLEDLAANHPEAGVHFQGNRSKDANSTTASWFAELLSSNPWFKGVVPNFRQLPSSALPPGVNSATVFTSVCINTAIYLPWLVSQCLKNGCIFKRAVFGHILEAARPGIHPSNRVDLIVNCTGLMASKLGGVEDKTVVPARGQIVIVRNDAGKMMSVSGTDDGNDEACYIMTRAAGGGTILGGSYQKGNWESQADPNLAIRIMKRAVKMCPQLTGGKGIEHLDIIRHGVGLRPVREGGTRIDKERIGDVWVVHNYGAGGAGYQSSYGCAQDAGHLTGQAALSTPYLWDLVWKDLAVANNAVAPSQEDNTTERRQRRRQPFPQHTGFKFVQGRPKRKRKQKRCENNQFHFLVMPTSPDVIGVSNSDASPASTTSLQYEDYVSIDYTAEHCDKSPRHSSFLQLFDRSNRSYLTDDVQLAISDPNPSESWSKFPGANDLLSTEFGMILPSINLPYIADDSMLEEFQPMEGDDHPIDVEEPPPLMNSVCYRNLAHKYGEILRLYDEEFCVVPLSTDCVHNPFRVPVERCESSPFLLHAILAISSHHLAKKNECAALTVDMHNHWSAAVQLFSKSLGQCSPPLLDTILILVNFDTTQSASSPWGMHLTGALSLLEQSGVIKWYQRCSRTRAQVAMLVWWDITVALISRREPIFPLSYLEMLIDYDQSDGWSFFILNACPVELVMAMARLAKLAAIYEKTTKMEWTIFDRTPVDAVIQVVRDFINREAVNFDEVEFLEEDPDTRRNRFHCIEAWRHAILLYACRVFTPKQDVYQICHINHLARIILDSVRSIPNTEIIQKQLLLPIFLAASEMGDEHNRSFVREYCKHWNNVSRFYHFQSALVLLESIWSVWDPSTRDVYWWGAKVGMKDYMYSNNNGARDIISELLLG
ncbi:hypothetical protein B7463_g881, partial [Scytalidium lignicola]